MFNRYLLNLYKQYCDARGIKCNQIETKDLSYDFFKWLTINILITKEYMDYISNLGYFNSKTIALVGKGRYDSVYLADVSIISPYINSIQMPKSELLVVDGVPLVKQSGKIFTLQQEVLLTYNPYEEMKIGTWSEIHNLGQYDISVGMYGNTHDADFDNKIKIIKELSQAMTDDHRVDYDTDNGKFFLTLNSKRKVIVKTLKR